MKKNLTTSLIRERIVALSLFVALAFFRSASGQSILSDPSLPVLYPDGQYTNVTATPTYVFGPTTVVLTNVALGAVSRGSGITVGPNQFISFGVQMTAMLNFAGFGAVPITFNGSASTEFFGLTGNTNGTFPMELRSMFLSGSNAFGLFSIRESPTLDSLGSTTVTSLAGGLYQIDSFFDVFTELSLDGGGTWLPDTQGSEHLVLGPVPEPSVGALTGVTGALLLLWRVRRNLSRARG